MVWASHDTLDVPGRVRGRGVVPWDESQYVQPTGVGGAHPGGRKAGGGSQSASVGRRGRGGGMAAPRSSGAVKVAPDVLAPARAGPGPSGGFVQRCRVRERTPAAERSRDPPASEGGLGSLGTGVARQIGAPAPRTRWAWSARCLSVASLPCCAQSRWHRCSLSSFPGHA